MKNFSIEEFISDLRSQAKAIKKDHPINSSNDYYDDQQQARADAFEEVADMLEGYVL